MVKGTIKQDWRQKPPTDRQIESIIHLSNVLGLEVQIPKNRGECSDKIGTLKSSVTNNMTICGCGNDSVFFYVEDEEIM